VNGASKASSHLTKKVEQIEKSTCNF